tara:strand:- start:147019 stop:147462 length:444 start_codon:yes stop_codon:yes gene_type:complete
MFRGYKRGFIIEVSSILSIFLGLIGSFTVSNNSDDFLLFFFKENSLPPKWVIFIISFIIIIFFTSFFAKYLTKFLKKIYLGRINKLLGLIFGFVKFATLICIFSFLLEEFFLFFSFENNSVFTESYVLPIVSNLNEIILNYLIDKKS